MMTDYITYIGEEEDSGEEVLWVVEEAVDNQERREKGEDDPAVTQRLTFEM